MTVAKAFGSAFAIRKHETLHDSRGMTVEKTVEALNAAHLVLLLTAIRKACQETMSLKIHCQQT